MSIEPKWESVIEGEVQRVAVAGGWLYRTCAWVELPSGSSEPNRGYWHWSNPTFSPDPEARWRQAALTDAEVHALRLWRGGNFPWAIPRSVDEERHNAMCAAIDRILKAEGDPR